MFGSVPISKYAGVAVILIASGFGLPIPEEVPIVGAGALVGHDAHYEAFQRNTDHDDLIGALAGGGGVHANNVLPEPSLTKWWIMLPVCILSVVLGDSVLYTVGRLGGTKLLSNGWVQRRLLPPDRQAKIIENFHKNGIMILLGARLTPGLRSPVFLMAGVLKMPLRRFLLADGLYAIPGVSILFWLSYVFTDQFVALIHKLDAYRPLLITVVLSAIAGALIDRFIIGRKTSTGDLTQIPGVAKPVAAVANAVEKTVEKAVSAVDKVTHPNRARDAAEAPPHEAVHLPVVAAEPAPAETEAKP